MAESSPCVRPICYWLTDLPVELASEIFRHLSTKDLANLRLADTLTLAYVNAYWEEISPLFRNRSTEYVVRLQYDCNPKKFSQGKHLCVNRWGLPSDLFTAAIDWVDVPIIIPAIRDSCNSVRIIGLHPRETSSENVATSERYASVAVALRSMPALRRLSVRGEQLSNSILYHLLGDAETLAGALQHLEIIIKATFSLELEADLQWRNANTELNLNSLVSDLSEISSLKSLSISGCGAEMAAVRSIAAPDISRLSNLTALHLARNSSLRCLPPAIGQLTRLQILDLEHSSISLLPDETSCLFNLVALRLESCPLRALPPLRALVHLQYLDLQNSLKGDLPFFNSTVFDVHEALSTLTALTRLRIGGNRDRLSLSSLASVLSRLTGLRELDMQRLGLHAIPAAVADLTRLTSLYLTGNNIEEIPPWIVSLVCLRVLDLRLNSLTGALPPCVLALTALTELRLGRNRFLIRTDVLRVLKRRGVEIGLSSDA